MPRIIFSHISGCFHIVVWIKTNQQAAATSTFIKFIFAKIIIAILHAQLTLRGLHGKCMIGHLGP